MCKDHMQLVLFMFQLSPFLISLERLGEILHKVRKIFPILYRRDFDLRKVCKITPIYYGKTP